MSESARQNGATETSGSVRHSRSSRRRTALWLVVAIVIGGGAYSGLRRGLKGKPDWPLFQRDSQAVWEQGRSEDNTTLFGYLPTAIFALWPFTVFSPEPLGLILFVASNVAAAAASIRMVSRWPAPRDHARRDLTLIATLLVSANFAHAIQANQLTMWTLLLCVGGLTLIGKRRDFTGGVVLGLAGLIKIMPFMLAGLLLIRGRRRALAGMAVAIVLFDLLPSMMFFGWNGAVAEHQAWLRRAEWHSNTRLIDDPLLRVHRHGHNSAYSLVLARWLRPAPDTSRQLVLHGESTEAAIQSRRAHLGGTVHLTHDPMPHVTPGVTQQEFDIGWVPRFHIASFSPRVVWRLWATTLTAAFVGLVWFTWRCTRSTRPQAPKSFGRPAGGDWHALGALWMLAMLWPSPMLRHYYLAFAFPAVVVVWRALAVEMRRTDGRWSPGAALAAIALISWLVGVICLGSYAALNLRWYGIHVAALAILAAATVWTCRTSAMPVTPEPDSRPAPAGRA